MELQRITSRELQVLELVSVGLKGHEIASRLFLSPETIYTHKKKIMDKLKAKNAANLIYISMKAGLLQGSLPSPGSIPSPGSKPGFVLQSSTA